MSDISPPESRHQSAQATTAKPGTACLGCRRRKLKCSREQEGCTNCTKADLPCVYPQPETGAKRKRGPYKKDKPARERHLEDLVRYLEPKTLIPDTWSGAARSQEAERGTHEFSVHLGDTAKQNSQPQDLVKDALIALTRSSASERANGNNFGGVVQAAPQARVGASVSTHPPARQVFEYWHLFITRVEPLTKIFHCSTFARNLFTAIDEPEKLESSAATLLFSVYYSAVSTCTTAETRTRFGADKEVLLHQYSRTIESALADNYGMPTLESVQALVLYIICLRRQDDNTNLKALFGLAVRLAQMIGLHQDPAEKGLRPFECELRRRLWFHICQLESRGAEEGGARSTSVMKGSDLRFPANVNDCDLDPRAVEMPVSRVGITEMTFVRVRWEAQKMVYKLWTMKKQAKESGDMSGLRAQQDEFFTEAKARLKEEYLDHMDSSRPYDWMCRLFLEGMIHKVRMMIEHPFGQIPKKDMSLEERFKLLQASVYVIKFTHSLATDRRTEQWQWFFRGYIQWHSLAIVVAELPRITDRSFTLSAWAVLDPILANWDKTYALKQGEEAWEHVHALVEKAREMRKSSAKGKGSIQPSLKPLEQPRREATSALAIAPEGGYTASRSTSWTNTATESPTELDNSDKQHLPFLMQGQLQPHISTQTVVTSGYGQHPIIPIYGTAAFDFNNNLSNMYDLAHWDGFEQVDFGAFDQVFENWEFPDPRFAGAEMSGMMSTYDA